SGRRAEPGRLAHTVHQAMATARHGGDAAIGRDAADAVSLSSVSDINRAVGRDRKPERLGESRKPRIAVTRSPDAVAGKPKDPGCPAGLECGRLERSERPRQQNSPQRQCHGDERRDSEDDQQPFPTWTNGRLGKGHLISVWPCTGKTGARPARGRRPAVYPP